MRRLFFAVAAALLAATALAPVVAEAAGREANLSATSPSASWTESAPMTGTAPLRFGTCDAPTHPCDEFTLHVDRGTDTSLALTINLTPSANAHMAMTIYPPGCAPGVFPTCITTAGHRARLLKPANGDYLVQVVCQACTAATYAANATLAAVVDHVPPAGDQSFAWAVQQLPLKKNGFTSFGEPGISINKLGHGIVNTFGPTVWITTDNGHSWTLPIDTVDSTGCAQASGDADAVVADDDIYYADNLCFFGPTNLSYSSQDGGKTWNGSKAGAPDEPGVATDSDRQWYALDPSDPAVVYFSYHDFVGPQIWVNKSTDHGKTWPQQVPITLASENFVDTGASNTSSRPLVDPTDPKTVLVYYTSNMAVQSGTARPDEPDFALRQVYLARSTDGGLTWTNSLVYDAGQTNGQDNRIAHLFAAAAIDAKGNSYAVVSERKGGQNETHLQLLRVPKGSTGLAAPVQVDQGGLGSNVFPWVAAGDEGRIAVSWYGSTAGSYDDVEGQWAEMFATTADALASKPAFTQSRVSGPSAMHAADICEAGTACILTGGNRNLSDFQMITVDPCGYTQMVWTDDAHGASVTMHARQTAGPSLRPGACPAGEFVPSPAGDNNVAGNAAAKPDRRNGILPATGDPWMWLTGAAVLLLLGAFGTRWLHHRHRADH